MKLSKSLTMVISLFLVLVFVSLSFLTGCSGTTTPTTPATSKAPAATTAAPPPPQTSAPAPAPASSPAPASKPAASSPAAAPAKTYDWKATSNFGAGHPMNDALLAFADGVNKKSNGAIKITVFQNTLGQPTDAWDMTKNATVQFTQTAEAFNTARMPISSIVNLPFEVPGQKANIAVMNAWLKAGYLKELTDNFQVLSFISLIPQTMFLRNKQVKTLEDLKGMKIRSLSGVQGGMLNALGATGISMTSGDVYMGLQTGTIDASCTGVDNYLATKLNEVTKYVLRQPLFEGIGVLVMNKDAFNSLTPDLQAIVTQTAADVYGADAPKKIAAEDGFWADVAKAGIISNTLTPEELARWKVATKDVAGSYIKSLDDKGLQGSAAYKLMQDTVAANK